MRNEGVRFADELASHDLVRSLVLFPGISAKSRVETLASRATKRKALCMQPSREVWVFHLQ
jgi:hypothetical protein